MVYFLPCSFFLKTLWSYYLSKVNRISLQVPLFIWSCFEGLFSLRWFFLSATGIQEGEGRGKACPVPVSWVAGPPLAPCLPSGGETGAPSFPSPDVQGNQRDSPSRHLLEFWSSSWFLEPGPGFQQDSLVTSLVSAGGLAPDKVWAVRREDRLRFSLRFKV